MRAPRTRLAPHSRWFLARQLARRAAALAVVFALLTSARSVHAQARIQGAAPDIQIAGGVGLGLDHKLANNFLGRVRAGVLYAYEPYWVDAGFVVEVGALSDVAIGGELEWNEFHGVFANAGVTYNRDERLTGHLTAGYLIFGLEYQHLFADRNPSEALLFSVRFPLGFWWFTSGREQRPFTPPPTTSEPAAPQKTAASPAAPAAPGGTPIQPRPVGPQPPPGTAATVSVTVDPQTRERLERSEHALDEATLAGVRGDYAAQSDALRRAYAAQPDAALFIRIADAEIARGRRAVAAEALQQFLASTATTDSAAGLAQKSDAETKLHQLLPQLARLRLTLAGALGDEEVSIDGEVQRSVLLGYDVLIDLGSHLLSVRRAGTELLQKPFEARAGELVRLEFGLPPPAAAP
jgi:hypothetical protein